MGKQFCWVLHRQVKTSIRWSLQEKEGACSVNPGFLEAKERREVRDGKMHGNTKSLSVKTTLSL